MFQKKISSFAHTAICLNPNIIVETNTSSKMCAQMCDIKVNITIKTSAGEVKLPAFHMHTEKEISQKQADYLECKLSAKCMGLILSGKNISFQRGTTFISIYSLAKIILVNELDLELAGG